LADRGIVILEVAGLSIGGAVDLSNKQLGFIVFAASDDNGEHIEQQIVKIYARRVLFQLSTAACSTLGTPRARAFV